jgi:hypothetical protein
MSGAKRLMERAETVRSAAIGIALQAGTLNHCMIHEDCIIEGNGDVEGAYRLGNYKFSRGELAGIFESRREMTDAIKAVVEENGGAECPQCSRD